MGVNVTKCLTIQAGLTEYIPQRHFNTTSSWKILLLSRFTASSGRENSTADVTASFFGMFS
jgi:hypothetical protein